MATRKCYHCKQQIEDGDAHDCWTTTEAALTRELSEDLQDAWERLRETAAALGEQRIYASHNSIMFSRTSCYCFVRPKRKYLEVCIFLGRTVTGPAVRRADRTSKTKIAHMLRIQHRDEVEAPITEWLAEAYEWCAVPRAEAKRKVAPKAARGPAASPKRRAARKTSGASRASNRPIARPARRSSKN